MSTFKDLRSYRRAALRRAPGWRRPWLWLVMVAPWRWRWLLVFRVTPVSGDRGV